MYLRLEFSVNLSQNKKMLLLQVEKAPDLCYDVKHLFRFCIKRHRIVRCKMKQKKVFYTEIAYLAGILTLAFGTALMEWADYGMSMVVAPAYLLYLKLSQYYPAFTFGMAEYVLQAFLLIVLSLVLRKFKLSYLFSFATALMYGFALDLFMLLVGSFSISGTGWRIAFFIGGMLVCAAGVSLLFHTYISPEAYELVVKELSAKFGWNISKVKTVYDCCSCIVGISMSFAFFGFGHFEGVKLGTIICALVNGWIIGQISMMLERGFEFKDAFPWRPVFDR